MTAIEELIQRYVESGHPYPREAVAFACGGSEKAARELLDTLDAPRQSGAWQGFEVTREDCRICGKRATHEYTPPLYEGRLLLCNDCNPTHSPLLK